MSGVSSRNFGLDLLRAIAIGLVIFSHCSFLLADHSDNLILNIVRSFGAIGVDLFFVLSGYLIGGILIKYLSSGRTSFKDLLIFWKRRWLRTLPNYFLILIINIIVFSLLGNSLFNEIWLYVPFLQNLSSPHPDFFTEAWSLSIEEYAYLLLPFCLFLILSITRTIKVKRIFIIVTFSFILLLFLLKLNYYVNYELHSYKQWSMTFRKVVIYRLDAIYFGFILVYITKSFPAVISKLKNVLFVLGIILFAVSHFAIYFYEMWPQTWPAFYVFWYLQIVVTSLGLMFPLITTLRTKKWLNALVYYVSTRSYAIYLINYSLVLLVIQHFTNVSDLNSLGKVFIILGYLCSTLILSELLYVYFERPILKFRDKKYIR